MSSTQRTLCEYCETPLTAKQQKQGNRFCGTSCSAKWRMSQPEIKAKVHNKEVHARIGKKVSAWLHSGDPKAEANIERIRNLNPTERPEVRAKISRTLRRIGHKPKIRGGNGRPMPKPQRMLLTALGRGWEAEHIQSIKPRPEGYPTHYKIDIANPQQMIAIEIDGFSHVALTRRAQDAKKDAKLRELGWTVLRFTNQAILDSLDTVINQVALYSTTLK